jgi:hypothetical protein
MAARAAAVLLVWLQLWLQAGGGGQLLSSSLAQRFG